MVADGDTDLQTLVREHLGSSVITNCDPNHYAKGLLKNVTNLCSDFPVLHNIAAKLKQHFLIGTLFSPHCSCEAQLTFNVY